MQKFIDTLKNALLLSFVCVNFLQAQADSSASLINQPWTTQGSVSLSFANVGLENWSGGGEPSVSFGTIIDLSAKRQSTQTIWETHLNFAYGIARIGGPQSLFKKTDDLLIFKSNYNYRFTENWSLVAFLDFRTQTTAGYTFKVDSLTGQEKEDKVISEFMAPAYLLVGLGAEYRREIFKVNVSPFTSKTTFVFNKGLADQGLFGVEKGQNIRTEIGANLAAAVDLPIMENVNFKTNLNLFYNYATPEFMDVNWETLLVLKVNKFINTSFATQLIYDNDADILNADGTTNSDAQFKHVLNINVGFSF